MSKSLDLDPKSENADIREKEKNLVQDQIK